MEWQVIKENWVIITGLVGFLASLITLVTKRLKCIKEEKEFKIKINKLNDKEKSILREFVMQSDNCEENDYMKAISNDDNVSYLLHKNFLVKIKDKTDKIIMCEKSALTKKFLTNKDIGFPQNEITPEIKEKFKDKRPQWVYPVPQPKPFEVIGNVFGKRRN